MSVAIIEKSEIKVMGITSDFDSCQLCGKSDLKKVVVLDIDGEIVYYGACCAAKTLGLNGHYTTKNIDKIPEVMKTREIIKQRRAVAVERAISEYYRFNEPIHVIRLNDAHNHNVYTTRRESTNHGHIFKSPEIIIDERYFDLINN